MDIGFQQRTKELHKEKERDSFPPIRGATPSNTGNSVKTQVKAPPPKKYDEKLVAKAQKIIRRHLRRKRLAKWKNLGMGDLTNGL